jgi:hypothetical protein
MKDFLERVEALRLAEQMKEAGKPLVHRPCLHCGKPLKYGSARDVCWDCRNQKAREERT